MKAYVFSIDTNTLLIESYEYDDDGGFCGCISECNCAESARYNDDGWGGVHSESRVSADVAKKRALGECVRLRDLFERCIVAIEGRDDTGAEEFSIVSDGDSRKYVCPQSRVDEAEQMLTAIVQYWQDGDNDVGPPPLPDFLVEINGPSSQVKFRGWRIED